MPIQSPPDRSSVPLGSHRSSRSTSHYAPQFPMESSRNSHSNWVDPTRYNGPPPVS